MKKYRLNHNHLRGMYPSSPSFSHLCSVPEHLLSMSSPPSFGYSTVKYFSQVTRKISILGHAKGGYFIPGILLASIISIEDWGIWRRGGQMKLFAASSAESAF